MMPTATCEQFLGIDLGGTKILAIVGTAGGLEMGESLVPTSAEGGPEAVVATMGRAARKAVRRAGLDLRDVTAVGVGAAGGIDPAHGIVDYSPNLPGWHHVPLGELLAKELLLPVFVSNDANMAALGEQRYGAGRGIRHLLFVTVSTGIGGAIVVNGRLYEGHHGYAGEIGHISMQPDGPYGKSRTAGALEAIASGTALAEEARRRLALREPSLLRRRRRVTAEAVFEALQQGDALARSVVDRGIRYLGAGLASMVNVVDPEMLIIGGGLSNQWAAYIEPAVDIMRDQAFADLGKRVRVTPAALGVKAGARGAIALAYDALHPEPAD